MTQQQQQPIFSRPNNDELRTIITDPRGAKTMVEWAEKIGRAIAPRRKDDKRAITTSQVRALFGEIRQIQAEWQSALYDPQRREQASQIAFRRLTLLKPKMAYRVGKETNQERRQTIKTLVDILTPAIDLVLNARERTEEEHKQGIPVGAIANTKDDNFQRFAEFFEAILAYHKAHGGQ